MYKQKTGVEVKWNQTREEAHVFHVGKKTKKKKKIGLKVE